MNCLYCASDFVNKNGKLESGGQRWRCFDCSKQFSIGGKRGTYTKEFKDIVINNYCHSGKTARAVVKEYNISSTTLIKWKDDHVDDCEICSKL